LLLNLINKAQSDIGCKTPIFLDGQPHIVLDFTHNSNFTEEVKIIAHITSPTDLMTFLMAKDVLDNK
jgi:hypothetical protein